uniref:Uncharacterized protein n=1 Tax=Zea mays TaxID=4577 RepID=C0HI80_MAIZE|nr:unknown [Zea mays]
MPRVAGRAAGAQRRVPLLGEQGRPTQGAAQGDRRWPGKMWATVPVGRAHAGRQGRARKILGATCRGGSGRALAGGLRGADQGPWPRRHVVGAAGGCAQPPRYRRIRHPLRVELDAGGDRGGGADAVLATGGRGAEDEQGVYNRGHGRRDGDGGLHDRSHQS